MKKIIIRRKCLTQAKIREGIEEEAPFTGRYVSDIFMKDRSDMTKINFIIPDKYCENGSFKIKININLLALRK